MRTGYQPPRVHRWAVVGVALVAITASSCSVSIPSPAFPAAGLPIDASPVAVPSTADTSDTGTGESGASDDVTWPKPCTLLTAAEVAAVVGDGQEVDTDKIDACGFGPTDPKADDHGTLLTITDNGPAIFAASRQQYLDAGMAVQDVPGLGDGAIFHGCGDCVGGSGPLTVLKGQLVITVSVTRPSNAPITDAQALTRAQTLMQKVLARLG